MPSPKEIRDAQKRVNKAHVKLMQAEASLAQIRRLPRRVGSRVRWGNGVIWIRRGDDHWEAEGGIATNVGSAHVAQFAWMRLSGK